MADNPNAVAAAEPPAMPNAVAGPEPSNAPAQDPNAPQLPEEIQRMQQVLDAHKITSPDDVTGLISDLDQFKKNFGDSQNEVGELRRHVQYLTQQLEETQRTVAATPGDPYADPNELQKPINVREEMKGVLKEFVTDYQQQTSRAQQHFVAQRQRLAAMPNWAALEPAFNQAMASPQVQQAMASGQTDMEKVYLYLNQNLILSVAKGAQEAIDLIPAGARRTLDNAPPAPGDGRVPAPPTEDEQRRLAREDAIKRGDGQGLLRTNIPDGDPIIS